MTGAAGARMSAPRHAIILAAGRGRRMGPLTADRPKCMLTVAGIPMIDRTLARLRSQGCRRVTVVTGYQHDRLTTHLRSGGGSLSIATVHNPRWDEADSMLSLFLALTAVDEPVWVLESDVVFDESILELPGRQRISWFADSASIGLGGVYVTRDEGGLLRSVQIRRKPSDRQAGEFKSAGLLRLDAYGVGVARQWLTRAVAEGRIREPYDRILGDHLGDPALGVVDVSGVRWFECDTPEELALADRMFGGTAGMPG